MIKLEQLVLASHNAGKLKELQAMLGASVKVRSIGEFSQVEPEETGLSFVENAILKARNAARLSGLPALADDSGLAVDFLGGAPGIYSARYADGRGDAANNAKLLEAMKDVRTPSAARSSSACWRWCATPTTRCRSSARASGKAASSAKPAAPMASATTAVLGAGTRLLQRRAGAEEKNRLSHRARAMALLKQRLGL
ncbi:dITP/XTP pyrophosphatase [Pseudomonas aeruginosa]|nr:dITP/XTP pyrophosphatase [Pseudomonas aeruginosa]